MNWEYGEVKNYSYLHSKTLAFCLPVTDLPYPEVSTSLLFSNVTGDCNTGDTLYTTTARTIQHCANTCGQDYNCSAFVVIDNTPNVTTCVMKTGKCEVLNMSQELTGNQTYLKGIDTSCE